MPGGPSGGDQIGHPCRGRARCGLDDLDVVVKFCHQSGVGGTFHDQHVGGVDQAQRADGEEVTVAAPTDQGDPSRLGAAPGAQSGGRGGQGARDVATDPHRPARIPRVNGDTHQAGGRGDLGPGGDPR